MKILIVDDNRDALRSYFKALLSRIELREWAKNPQAQMASPSLEVDEADTVPIALEKLRTQSYEMSFFI